MRRTKQLSSILLVTLVVYANLTAMEWLVHKYVMHGYDRVNFPVVGSLINHESEAHWEHHREVKSDLSLDIDDKEHKHKGLFFRYKATISFTLVLFVILSLQFKALKLKIDHKVTGAIGLFSTITYSFLWNNFHALLHGADNIILPGTKGVSNKYQNRVVNWVPQIWFEWMMLNHAQHHAVKGRSKGNYNIILPGFDYVMGTYNNPPCFDNTNFCQDSDIGACDKPKGCFKVEGTKLHVAFDKTLDETLDETSN